MAWSYSGNPGANPKDFVRFEMQDIDSRKPLLRDEEIQFAIDQEAGSPPEPRGLLCAAARCCEVLARRFSAQADTVVGSIQVTYSKQAAGYTERAAELRARAQGSGEPFVGGRSRAEKQALRSDRDRVQPAFHRDQFMEPHVRSRTNPILPQGEI